jgi:hypothetical protein
MFCAPLTQEDEDAPRCIEAEINAGGLGHESSEEAHH